MRFQKKAPNSIFYIPRPNFGFGLIEILIASAILSTSLVILTATTQISFRIMKDALERTQAGFLSEEGIEIVRTLRDGSWSSYIAPRAVGVAHYPVFATTTAVWSLSSTTPPLIENLFTRTITFYDVYRRNSDGEIVPLTSPDPKTLDPDTREVLSRVSWGIGSEVSVSYIDGTTDGDLASFPSNNAGSGDPAQSFTTGGSNITVPSVELLFKKVVGTTPSDVFLEIRSGSVTGTVLGTSNTVRGTDIPDSALVWTMFSFSSPVALSTNTQYFLRLRSIPDSTEAFSGSSGTLHIGYRQTASSPYSLGKAYRYVGRLGNPNDAGQMLDQYDFSFRVYTENTSARNVETRTYITNIFQN